MLDCIFCKIVKGEIPSKKVYEDDKIVAFHDISKMAPVHIIVIPKEHIIESAAGVRAENSQIIAYIFEKIPTIARDMGVIETGFRIITNSGTDAKQTIKHLHFHILGGKELSSDMS